MMPIAMTMGIILHQYVGILSPLIPYLIFVMLLLTYIKLSWRDIRFTRMHLWLIVIQLAGSIGIYFILNPINTVLAQGVMICVLAPTATSAPVITGMLKGNVASLTAYSLISNLSVAVVAPLLFSYIGYNELPFFSSLLEIAQRVGLLLIAPFVLTILLNKFLPKTSAFLQSKSGLSFYLWSIALTVVTGRTVQFVIDQGKSHIGVEIAIAALAFVVCGMQFYFGRKIGRKHDDTVAGGQGLGQKNTVLAIWMSQMYLNPLSSIGPGAYVVWQNIVNSYQVWRKRKNL
ncbi:MAG: Bile acid:sodium symporter [Bacteroidetes bacterium]|nr:Bile acid:sodium symporter [Bacteroidota bacterium]